MKGIFSRKGKSSEPKNVENPGDSLTKSKILFVWLIRDTQRSSEDFIINPFFRNFSAEHFD